MHLLRLGLISVAALALGLVARAADDSELRSLTGKISATACTIQARNTKGNVTVVAVSEGFGWEWKLRAANGRTDRAVDYAAQCQLEVNDTGGSLSLALVRPGEDRRDGASNDKLRRVLSVLTLGAVDAKQVQVESHLTLRVPAACVVVVRNKFGNVRVAGVERVVTIDAEHARVELTQLPGAVTARTSFGSLRAQGLGSAHLTTQHASLEVREVAGDLRATVTFAKLLAQDVKGAAVLKNQNGSIEATRIAGDVSATTSFANLRVEAIGGRAELKGQNGRLEAKGVTGELAATNSFGGMRVESVAGGARLKNQNGNIEAVRVTGDLVAETSFGEIRAEDVGGAAHVDSRNGKIELARVTGAVRANNSFAPLRLRDIGGDVELIGRNAEIVANGLCGDVRAETSFARLHIEGSGKRFVARNQNGSVEIVARSAGVEAIDATSSFATINVQLPKDAKPLIRATIAHGKVHSAFPVLQGDTVSDAGFAAETAPLKVSLRGQNGDIRIQRIAGK